jgi:glutamyl-tRNA reductase
VNGIRNLSITHKWASLNDLECARIDNVEGALKAMHATDGVSECVIVQTCNRIELYLNVTNEFDVNSFIARFFPSVPPELIGRYEARESLRHLMRLAAGLDSMIVGEDQILGQLKEAVEIATNEDTLGPDLGLALSKAIKAGKRVRTETHINRGSVSSPNGSWVPSRTRRF